MCSATNETDNANERERARFIRSNVHNGVENSTNETDNTNEAIATNKKTIPMLHCRPIPMSDMNDRVTYFRLRL